MNVGIDYIGVGVGAIIVNKEGKYFLNLRGKKARNEKGKWEFPGGKLEFGESLQESIIREIQEEFGFKIKPTKQLSTYNHIIPDELQHWVAIAYLCEVVKGEPKILEPHKSTQIGWFDLDEIEKLPLTLASAFHYRILRSNIFSPP